ncbi:MAG: glycosyltransferase [Planctomycetes bacterium]|nr:glycosyltransferase [Planctomycetota bacterium]
MGVQNNIPVNTRYDDMFTATAGLLDRLDVDRFLKRMGDFFMGESADAAPGSREGRTIGVIALFVPTLRGGGIERVAINLSTSWLNRGYRVVVFTDEKPTPGDYRPHEKLQRVVLPTDRRERWNAVRENLRAVSADICIFFDGWRRQTQYDFYSAKLTGCLTVQSVHNMFFYPAHELRPEEMEWLLDYGRFADALTCLSTDNLLWWRASGMSRSARLPNQITFDPAKVVRSDGTTKNVLYIARLTEIKGVRFLPEIIRKIAAQVPDFKLQILGQSSDGLQENWFRKEIARLGLEANVEMIAFTPNTHEFIARAAVLIMPSRVEGQPLVRLEAATQGVPNVVFSMPYLEPTGEENGCIQVGKEDVDGMAGAVVRLLSDHDYWQRMSDNAIRGIIPFSEENILAEWERLFQAILSNRVEEEFAPAKAVDAAFLEETMREVRIAFRQRQINGKSFFYRYLHPDGWLIATLLPKGTGRRKAAAYIGHWLQQKAWELKQYRNRK